MDRMTNARLPVLSVGAVLGDSDAASIGWSRLIGALSRKVELFAVGMSSPLCVNVIFHVDGRLVPNDFEGVRTGRFTRSKSMLVVQAVVPLTSVESEETMLVTLLGEAVVAAETFAVEKNLAQGLPDIRELVRRIQNA